MLVFFMYMITAGWYVYWRVGILDSPISYMLLVTECMFLVGDVFMYAGICGGTDIPTISLVIPETSCDIFICCYNEPIGCIMATITGSLRQDMRVTVYVCDDGRNLRLLYAICKYMGAPRTFTATPDGSFVPDIRCANNLHGLFALTDQICVRFNKLVYISRFKPTPHHAKAGNLNNVLNVSAALTNAEYVAVLDADMCPDISFASRLISQFYKPTGRRQNTAFCQSPQTFTNIPQDDPFAHRNSVFFNAICPRRSWYKMAPFAGSNAVFRRDIIMDIKFQTESITEDMLTAQVIHARGFGSRYINEPLAVGQAPVCLYDTIVQRMRWQMGSIQIFMRKNCMCSKTEWPTRWSTKKRIVRSVMFYVFYINSSIYSFGSFATCLFMLFPLFSATTGQQLAKIGSLVDITCYFFPYLIMGRVASYTYCNSSAADLWREMQLSYWLAFAYCAGIARVLIGSVISFDVTPKTGRDDVDVESPTNEHEHEHDHVYRNADGWILHAPAHTHTPTPTITHKTDTQATCTDPVKNTNTNTIQKSWLATPPVAVFVLNICTIAVFIAKYMLHDIDKYMLVVISGYAIHINLLLWPGVVYTFWVREPDINATTHIPTCMYYINTLGILGYITAIVIWEWVSPQER